MKIRGKGTGLCVKKLEISPDDVNSRSPEFRPPFVGGVSFLVPITLESVPPLVIRRGRSGAGIALRPAMSLLTQPYLTRRWWNRIEDNAAKVRKARSFWALPLAGPANFHPPECISNVPGDPSLKPAVMTRDIPLMRSEQTR
jgi:hypothetical protein